MKISSLLMLSFSILWNVNKKNTPKFFPFYSFYPRSVSFMLTLPCCKNGFFPQLHALLLFLLLISFFSASSIKILLQFVSQKRKMCMCYETGKIICTSSKGSYINVEKHCIYCCIRKHKRNSSQRGEIKFWGEFFLMFQCFEEKSMDLDVSLEFSLILLQNGICLKKIHIMMCQN